MPYSWQLGRCVVYVVVREGEGEGGRGREGEKESRREGGKIVLSFIPA